MSDELNEIELAMLSAETLDALDRASGKLASAALAAMDEQFAWFSRMPADQRGRQVHVFRDERL